MIETSRGIRKECYFANRPDLSFGFFSRFYSTRSTEDFPFFRREDFFTKIVKLNEDFESNFSRSCRRDVEAAKRKGFSCEAFSDFDRFIELLELFYVSRQFGPSPPRAGIERLRQHLMLTAVRADDRQVLNIHSYLVDRGRGVARLWHSFENESRTNRDTVGRSAVGLANRLLHWHDMRALAGSGITEYDFGGYAFEAGDAKLNGINAFKDGFGGELVRLSHYVSVFDRWLDAARRFAGR
ncbi:MAG: hypothetical protein HS128_09500 [Ideonella sp.]|nr:hypothetical protein [Ideonella sp.]